MYIIQVSIGDFTYYLKESNLNGYKIEGLTNNATKYYSEEDAKRMCSRMQKYIEFPLSVQSVSPIEN